MSRVVNVSRIKNSKIKKVSSKRWLLRHMNDPYVQMAKGMGYRSRAAFKLIDIEKKFRLIARSSGIVDIGSAPGGWSQVASEIIYKKSNDLSQNCIVSNDILSMDPIQGVTFIQGDFQDDAVRDAIIASLPNGVDLVLSDIAPNTIGHSATDNIRITQVIRDVLGFSKQVLRVGGALVVKTWRGGADSEILAEIKLIFSKVCHFKPPSSRTESNEMYLVAIGFRKQTQ